MRKRSLNPYFFGKCSTANVNEINSVFSSDVLILIFLENALRPQVDVNQLELVTKVLILIFLENALRQVREKSLNGVSYGGLNPYFFGKCSTAAIKKTAYFWCSVVS